VHPVVRDFVEDVIAAVPLPDPIFEFGAMQVEEEQNTDLRPLFAGRPYVGTDFREGPGVDRVEDLRALTLEDGEVGTAICLETLEHCEDPISASRELTRVVADGGACVVSAPMLIGIHGYPQDYFRYTPEAFRSMFGGFDDVWAIGYGDPAIPQWTFGVAVKGRRLDLSLERMPRLAAHQERFDRAEGRFRIGPFHIPPAELAKSLARQLPRVVRERAAQLGARRAR
jgi:SAM-dependent methyltransferase